ncbi:hypothetical protein Klosneuvirus_2_27 [Klosneuvirus KNV1]|uniref:Uncharacterized protein n=1 Tax=Klosneuvirus KNV1 TaxID=1977640 RepID=A0A1V0SIW0_9VIRU|nr:hypothetical protein Klosneuvirus_2_27 [Klosneuvirus KNV1]
MQGYIDSLNNYYKDKSSFYKFIRINNNVTSPSDLIVALNKLNYNFTQQDFTKFVANATYQKKNGYINNKPYHETNYEEGIKIMFTKCTPNEKQFDHLISCHHPNYQYNKLVWIDALVAKKYNFSDKQKLQLAKVGYDMAKLYSDGTVTLEQLMSLITSNINKKSDITTLKDIVNKNKLTYTNEFIEQLLSMYPKQNYNNDYNYFNSILNIFFNDKNIKITDDLNNILIKIIADYNTINYFIGKNLVPNNDLMKFCSKTTNCGALIFYMHKKHNLQITTEICNKLFLQQNNYIGSNIPYLVTLGYEKELAEKCEIKNPYGNYSLNFIPLMIHLNIIPDEDTFNLSCEQHKQDLFEYCISHKMIPSKKHLKLALHKTLTDVDLQFINKLLCYKIIPDSDCLVFLDTNAYYPDKSKAVITLLMKFGYKPSSDGVKQFMKYNIHLDNLENLGIKFDDEFYYCSHINNNWTYDSHFKLKNEKILGLRQLCRKRDTSKEQVKEYMKTNDVKLDRYCFEHALINNSYLADWMVNELKCEPTITAHYWLSYNTYRGQTNNINIYNKLLEIHKIDNAYLSTPLQ